MKYVATIGEKEYVIEIQDERHLLLDGVAYEVDFVPIGDSPVYSLILDGQSYQAHVYLEDDLWQVLLRGILYSAKVEDEREKRLRAAMGGGPAEYGEYHLKAPMPGMVVAVPVREGQKIDKGDVLVLLESMKMQNELRSPRAGTVGRVRVKAGDSVEQRQTLLNVV